MFLSIASILAAGPYLAASCATGLHPLHMSNLLKQARGHERRQAETISVPTSNTTHWTVPENLREMQVTDDAFNSKDLARYNHAPTVTVYLPGGVTMGLKDHLTDMTLLYSQFPGVKLQNHNYPVRFGEGDWTITLTKVSGINEGPLPGSSDVDYIAPTLRDTSYGFMTIGRWEYGLLQDEYLWQDSVTMYRQLGLFPDLPDRDLPDIPFDPLGDVGPDAAAANKVHANSSDTALNSSSRNASQLLYSADLMVYGLTDEPMDLSEYMAYLAQTR